MNIVELQMELEQCERKLQLCAQYEEGLDNVMVRLELQKKQCIKEIDALYSGREQGVSVREVHALLDMFMPVEQKLRQTLDDRYEIIRETRFMLEARKQQLLESLSYIPSSFGGGSF